MALRKTVVVMERLIEPEYLQRLSFFEAFIYTIVALSQK
jgi:hypothetical protein